MITKQDIERGFIVLNEKPIEIKFYGKSYKLFLVGMLYADGNFAIIAFDEDLQEIFTDITINVDFLYKAEDEIILDHNSVSKDLLVLSDFLTDCELTPVQYNMASSYKLKLKEEIFNKLSELKAAIYK